MYIHSLSPFAVKLTETFGIRWYGLAYLCGFLCAYWIILRLSTRKYSPLSDKLVGDFIFAVALGTIVGGRLGYCLLYSPELFLRFSFHFPFWGVLAINEGGMASHGGILGIFVGCMIFGRKHSISFLHLSDLCALTGPIGIFFGRLANFVNGELVGRPVESKVPWGVKFPSDIFSWPAHDPQNLPKLGDVVPLVGIQTNTWYEWLKNLYSDQRVWMNVEQVLNKIIQRTQARDPEVLAALEPHLTLRHPSQLYEAVLEGVFLFIALALILRRRPAHGIVTAWFFILYSVVRILGEQFRLPDAHIGYQLLGLTRGQWLSFGLLLVGIFLLWFVKKGAKRNA